MSDSLRPHEYWSGLPFPLPENLPDPGIEPESPEAPELLVGSLLLSHRGSPLTRQVHSTPVAVTVAVPISLAYFQPKVNETDFLMLLSALQYTRSVTLRALSQLSSYPPSLSPTLSPSDCPKSP